MDNNNNNNNELLASDLVSFAVQVQVPPYPSSEIIAHIFNTRNDSDSGAGHPVLAQVQNRQGTEELTDPSKAMPGTKSDVDRTQFKDGRVFDS